MENYTMEDYYVETIHPTWVDFISDCIQKLNVRWDIQHAMFYAPFGAQRCMKILVEFNCPMVEFVSCRITGSGWHAGSFESALKRSQVRIRQCQEFLAQMLRDPDTFGCLDCEHKVKDFGSACLDENLDKAYEILLAVQPPGPHIW